jgi:hypothetical protein
MKTTRTVHLPVLVLLLAGSLAPPLRAGLPSRPTEQWRWDGYRDGFGAPVPDSTPLVVQLTDDDGDGDIDADDTPDVVFLHYGQALTLGACGARLTALDGATGVPLFTVDQPAFGTAVFGGGSGLLAAADLDGDGLVELVVTDMENVIVLHHDGTLAWSRPWPRTGQPACAVGSHMLGAALSIADLNGDGSPEIIHYATVLSADGSLAWTGTGGGGFEDFTSFSVAAELDPASNGLELLAGNTCYAADGHVLWHDDNLPEGAVAVGDVDGDGDPEIALAYTTQLFLLDHRGRMLLPDWMPLGFMSLLPPSVPVMAQLDRDPGREIVVAHQDLMHAFDWAGPGVGLVERWRIPIEDPSCCAGATAFDFDGDGIDEIVYRDHRGVHVFDGPTGAELDFRPFESGTGEEIPVVADIDGDCHAEIVATGISDLPFTDDPHDCVIAYDVAGSMRARPIWNQQLYDVSNVDDDARIPVVPVPPWRVPGGGFLAQVSVSSCPPCFVDLRGAPPFVHACAGERIVLDASALVLGGCAGATTYEWLDDGVSVGTGATHALVPAATTSLVVRLRCTTAPGCTRDVPAQVIVDTAPIFGAASAAEVSTCSHGIRVSWPPALFASGLGRYAVYRSDASGGLSCADALSHAPVATDLFGLDFLDASTVPGQSYVYAVVAEDDVDASRCAPAGPSGRSAATSCVAMPVTDLEGALPADAGPVLRAGHDGDFVTLAWPSLRPLLPGEHVHLRKALDPSSIFSLVNPEGDTSLELIDFDASTPLQFFDLRVASACEDLSSD